MQNNGKEQRMTKNRIGVFCAASERIDPLYMEKAEELGAWIGSQGKWLVYGGSNFGLMEATAKAVKANGGQVMGVVPTLLEERGRVSTLLDVIFPTVNLSDRRRRLLERAAGVPARTGGSTVYPSSVERAAESSRYFRTVDFIPYRLISKT